MKKITPLIALLITGSVHSEAFRLPYEAACDDTKIVVNKLVELNEIPIARGQTGDVAGTLMVMWVNPKSKAWTITATKDDITCIIGNGDQLKIIGPKNMV
jgi:hypothetical protein